MEALIAQLKCCLLDRSIGNRIETHALIDSSLSDADVTRSCRLHTKSLH